MQNRLYVTNLAEHVSAATLQELFEPYGFVMDVKVMAEGGAEPALGAALVTMATDESAGAAIRALKGVSVQGVPISVETAPLTAPALRGRLGGEP